MWGNLGNKLGSTDWNTTLQKLGNAVAPPPVDDDSYDDEDYDDEDYEEDSDYADEDEDEDEENQEDENRLQKGGYGLVGLLSRALDEAQADDLEVNNVNEEGEPLDNFADYVEREPEETTSQSTSNKQNAEIHNYSQTLPTVTNASSTFGSSLAGTNDFSNEEKRLSDDLSLNCELPDNEPNSGTKTIIPAGKQSPQLFGSIPSTNSDSLKEEDRLRLIESENKVKLQSMCEDNINSKHRAKSLQTKTGTERKTTQVDDTDDFKSISNNNDQDLNDAVDSEHEINNVVDAKRYTSFHGNIVQVTTSDRKSKEQKNGNFNQGAVESHKNLISSEIERMPKKGAALDQEHSSVESNSCKNAQAVASSADIENRYMIRLREAESRALELENRLASEANKFGEAQDRLILQFKEKEARLLQASAEEHQQEVRHLEQEYLQQVDSLEAILAKERSEYKREKQKSKLLVQQCVSRAEQAESDLRNSTKKHESLLSQASLQEKRAIHNTEEKLAQSLAVLDERNDEIAKLKQLIGDLENSMNEHAEGVEEAEQEVEELQSENEGLEEQLEALEGECAGLKEKVLRLQKESAKLGTLQMELTILREERDRERAKSDSMVQSTMTSHSQIETERDTALAEVRDLQQKLTAAFADLEIAKSDRERALVANNNLQSALEAFQDERQAEMSLLANQRIDAENSLKLAHDAAVEVIQQTHSAKIEQVRSEVDFKLKESDAQVEALTNSLEKVKAENGQMRRSLDEAIHRLQTTQEDVIDRTLMKNILLDWCTMKDKAKRQQVLQLMANVLHFTESEKEAVHLTNLNLESMSAKVVGALAAPIPPSKADVDQLQGSNVSEKWVNFLLAETDDGF